MGRPSGVSPQAWWANRLCTTSSGSSSCMAISSRMTSRSASTSAGVIVEAVTMSPSTSTAVPRSSSSTRAWKTVYSLVVKALNSPPTASSSTEMSIAVRSGVPLKSRCSRKWEHPCSAGVSSREPTPTHTPMLADREPAICSVTMRMPLGSTVRRTREVTVPSSSATVCRVRVVPVFCTGGLPVERGWYATTGRRRPPAGRGWSGGQVTRRRRTRRTPRSRPPPRRRAPARACRGRRSPRSGPGPSGRRPGRPRRPRRACRRRGRAAC